MHMKPLYGVKRKQANQPNHRVGCQNAPTFFSRRKHIQLNGGCMNLSILLQEVLCSPVSHWIRGAWAVQDKTTLPGISEEGLWVLTLALRLRPETAAWLTTELGHLLASLLVSQVLVLEVPPTTSSLLPRLFSPFLFSHGSHLCRPSVAFPQLSSHPGPHPLSRGDFHGWGSPQHSSTSAPKTRAPLLGSLPYRTAVSVLRAVWKIQADFCICQFYGAEGCSSGFFKPCASAFSLVSSHQLS